MTAHTNGLSKTGAGIVSFLKEGNSATIAQLAAHLHVSGEAIRQQVLQLEEDGLVERLDVPDNGRRPGRPPSRWHLTNKGEHLFPKNYDAFGVELLDAIQDRLGPQALKAVLGAIADARVKEWEPALKGRSLPEKAEALRSIYRDNDAHMSVEVRGGRVHLVEENCPYLNVALHRPALCSVTVSVLSRLLGARVVRKERFQNGDGRCVFQVVEDVPVEPDAALELESEAAALAEAAASAETAACSPTARTAPRTSPRCSAGMVPD